MALLDLGVYPISLRSFVLGRPASITAAGALLPNGLDAQTDEIRRQIGLRFPGE